MILLPGRLDLVFLPGGELMISVDEIDNSISLHRIKLSDGDLSLIQLADISRDERNEGKVIWNKMLPAMAPHPVFSYARANRLVGASAGLQTPSISDFEFFWRYSVCLFGITPEGNANLEIEFPIPNKSELLWVCGQGRTAGFLFQTGSESPVATIINLDHPGVSLEIQLPSDCGDFTEDLFADDTEPLQAAPESCKVCLPTQDLAVIYGGDYLLAYSLPPFTTLPHGNLRLEEGPTWQLSSILEDNAGARRYETGAEVFYDPSLPDPQFNVHLLHLTRIDDFDPQIYLGLITLEIDPSNLSSSPRTPIRQRIVRRFPIDGFIASSSLYPEIYHSRTRSNGEGLGVWVASLEGVSSSPANEGGEGERPLYMFFSNDELEPDLEWESVGLDEASGRAFIWGPTYRWMTSSETRIFVGELVS